jgi:hypothetical protein
MFKINKTEFCYFSLKVTTNSFKFFTYRIIAGDWIVFEPKVEQRRRYEPFNVTILSIAFEKIRTSLDSS